MRFKTHIRILAIATGVWFGFWIAGLPDYYLQYSTNNLILFVLLLILPISFIIAVVFMKVKRSRRLKIALWYAFYFTLPLAIYDGLYCGLYLGYGFGFIWIFWFLSIYYLIPWILFPAIALVLNKFFRDPR